MTYLWIKVLHILAIVSWMAGMLYLPRLFVYHAGVLHGSDQASLFEIMERRLQRYIMTPALVLTWITGLYLSVSASFFTFHWLHLKLALVLVMTAFHGYFSVLRNDLAAGRNKHKPSFFRVLNEAPTLLLIGIVILVVIKPFS